MINRISRVQSQPNRMQIPQNKQAKPAFGSADYYNGKSSLGERGMRVALTPEQESEVIADLTKKASRGDLKIDQVDSTGDKAFKSKDANFIVLIHKTKLNPPHICLTSNDLSESINIYKDDKMADSAKESYSLLEETLDKIKPNT